MNIQQLEYILAVDTYRHFAKAAEHCRVTQPTLSMMIQKLEDELGVKLFDRNTQPVSPTPAGRKVIDQARVVLYQTSLIKEIVNEEEQSLKGTFRLAVLPTISRPKTSCKAKRCIMNSFTPILPATKIFSKRIWFARPTSVENGCGC